MFSLHAPEGHVGPRNEQHDGKDSSSQSKVLEIVQFAFDPASICSDSALYVSCLLLFLPLDWLVIIVVIVAVAAILLVCAAVAKRNT